MLTCLVLGVSAPASLAVNWAKSSEPLKVSGYGSTGYGYGTWTVSSGSDGTRSRLTANLKYSNGDNHKVYGRISTWTNAGICISPEYTSCTATYYPYASNDTAHVNEAGKWVAKTATTSVNPAADYARGQVFVRLDIPLRPDPTSEQTLTKGVKY